MTVLRSQRFAALEIANDIRVRRAGLKRAVRNGTITVEALVREPEWFLLTVPVHELLEWAPYCGRARCSKVLRRADVWPLREVGQLTLRQRGRVLEELAR